MGLAYGTTAVTASAIAATLVLAAGWLNEATIDHPAFPTTLRLFAVLLVLLAFVRMHTAALKAVLSANGEVLLGRVLQPVARLLAVVAATALGYSVVGVVGATGILLSMTNNHYPKLVLEWLLALLNVVLTYVFVLEFGLVGAALGTSFAIGVQNLLQATLLRRFEGLWPFDATFLKPLAAGVGMGPFWSVAGRSTTGVCRARHAGGSRRVLRRARGP